MKRALTFILVVALVAISCQKEDDKDRPYNRDGSPVTQEQALKITKKVIDMYDYVYVSKSIVKAGTEFITFVNHKSYAPIDSWVVIINTRPTANSGQYWLYIYVDAYTGDASKESWEWGEPESFEYDIVKNPFINSSHTKADTFPTLSATRSSTMVSESDNWAVIISGGVNPYNNRERYWNDCSVIYKCLRQVYGYKKERILILMSDGTSPASDRHMNNGTYSSSPLDLDGDGTSDINYSASSANISTVFNFLRDNVSQDEQVLVFVTDHGFRSYNESYIWLWNGDSISATAFANQVKKINPNSRKHVVLGQCYSGGFIEPLSSQCSNISIATASAAEEESYATEDNLYDRFLYNWTNAATGREPDGTYVDAESNTFDGISTEELFIYAREEEPKNNTNEIETPQYFSNPVSVGRQYGLSGEKFPYLAVSGPRHVSSTPGNYVYELSGLPDNYSVKWLSGSNVSLSPSTGLVTHATYVGQSPMAEGYVTAEVTTPNRTYHPKSSVYFWRPGINFTTDLISGSLEQGCFSLPYDAPGVTGYQWMVDGYYDIQQSNAYFIDVPYDGNDPGSYHVSVDFVNPLGEQTTIVRHFNV